MEINYSSNTVMWVILVYEMYFVEITIISLHTKVYKKKKNTEQRPPDIIMVKENKYV